MMKQRTSFLMRCLSMAMALILLVSSANLGVVLQASAATDATIGLGEMIANNYSLTDAEKDLLKSGYLVGDTTISYKIPDDGDNLVTVDTDKKTVTADAFDNDTWFPVSAEIVVGGESKETVKLTNGVGSYTYSGNAFSVKVKYEMLVGPDTATQQNMLDAAAKLKQGVANTDAVSGQSGNLYILEQAMPELVNLATNDIPIGTTGATAGLSDAGKAAVNTLNAQLSANGGKLKLSVMVAAYDESTKTGYLMTNGAAMQAEVKNLVSNLSEIKEALTTLKNNVDMLVNYGLIDASTATQIQTLSGVVNNLYNALNSVAADPWTAANMGSTLVKADADYAKLDGLVAALGNTSSVTATNPLKVADTSVQANLNMKNVTVNVVLNVVANKADSTDLVPSGEAVSAVLTLSEGATAKEIEAEAQAVIDKAVESWGETYKADHYEATATELPDTLTEDITYNITYAPKSYTVTYEYTTDAPTSVPYGYQLTLPAHSNDEKSYDYQVDGEKYAQGAVYTVIGNVTISRSEGKDYASNDLYAIVSKNYGTAKEAAILTSGAVKGNETISYRYPDERDEDLVVLNNGVLTAATYESNYAGNIWVPYSYGGDNGTANLFGNSSSVSVSGKGTVVYRLYLNNISADEATAILQLADTLTQEAATQKETLDSLAAYYDTMGQLDKTKLGALNGVIDVTDFTPGDGTDTDEANLAMRKYFKDQVSGVIANNLDANNYLKIYNMLGQYKNEGLRYYYDNSETVINEINILSGYLDGMLDETEALEIMVTAAGYPEYKDKIADLGKIMEQVKGALTAPNAAIDLNSASLGKLLDALTAEGETGSTASGSPYVDSDYITAAEAGKVNVSITVEANGGTEKIQVTYDYGYIMTEKDVAGLEDSVKTAAEKLLGDYEVFYNTVKVDLSELNGKTLKSAENLTYSPVAKTYTVKIEGEANQTFTIENTEINLPKHTVAGYTYVYTINGEETTNATYTFSTDELKTLFVNGVYTITRVENNEAQQKWEGIEETLTKSSYVTIRPDAKEDDNDGKDTIVYEGPISGVMDFFMDIALSGYDKITINNKPFVYLNEEDSLEVSIQALIDGLLHDPEFGSEAIIEMGDGLNSFLKSSVQFIYTEKSTRSAVDENGNVDMDLEIYIDGVPGQLAALQNALVAVRKYVTFQADGNGNLNVNLNLPERVYQVYLTGLIAAGYVDKDDANAVNQAIAYQFLDDIIQTMYSNEDEDGFAAVTSTTVNNTAAKLGIDMKLTGTGANVFDYINDVLCNDTTFTLNTDANGNGSYDICVDTEGKAAVDLIDSIYPFLNSLGRTKDMVREYKAGENVTINVAASVRGIKTGYEAVVIDNSASGTDKFFYTTNAAGSYGTSGTSAVMLLGDVDGSMNFNGSAIVDLNGHKVSGDITASNKLIIVDSSKDTNSGASVSGTVSANSGLITGGKYSTDISEFLKDGYYQDNGTVRNTLFRVGYDGTTATYYLNAGFFANLDGDYTSFATATAVDIAVDLVLNYYTAAALNYGGENVYALNIDKLIGVIDTYRTSGKDAALDEVISDLVNGIGEQGITDLVNAVLADLVDFGGMSEALEKGTAIGSYPLTTNPLTVSVEHVQEKNEDYIDFGLTTNSKLSDSITIAVAVEGDNKYMDTVKEMIAALAETVTVNAEVKDLSVDYTGSGNTLDAAAGASVDVVIDLSKDSDYTKVIAVILAYGNSDKAKELVEAADCVIKLNKVIENMTVEEVFTALKTMSRNVSFSDMAAKVGYTASTEEMAALEEAYHILLCGAGKALEDLDVTGNNTKLSKYADDNGGYAVSKTYSNKSISRSAQGYTVDVTATELSASVTLKLAEKCTKVMGDVNSDSLVDCEDAVLIQLYEVGLAEETDLHLCVADVNCDTLYDCEDAVLIRLYEVGLIDQLPFVDEN